MIIIFLLCFVLLSSTPAQTESSSLPANNVNEIINISQLILSQEQKTTIIDSTNPWMAGINETGGPYQGPMSWPNMWNIYLPYADSLIFSVYNLRDSLINYSSTGILSKGYYRMILNTELCQEISGIYIIKTSVCNRTFARKFMCLK